MDKIVYKLVVKDLQIVSEKELGRKLNDKEISLLEKKIADKIPWYDVIAEAISDL